ncbi:MAG: recombinase family protein [Endomicrobia bacterium]|nr:recombinase family protein [Endomicrobiia bacterium]
MEEKKKIIKCAIYTRKSSEEGLELEFNSLQAQREACEAYIKSQKHEGWVLVEKKYDDGGFSGGTLDRPALKELLKDIERDLVNIIVVYKIDRLTRSLHDFSKIVDVFDKKQASFVSITQQFNTTTSMGRLTLNMLLSFAQFEREVTGERIRDKYAASKKKGMWMGGYPPMGYYRKEKKIYPSEHAKSVQIIFNKYIEFSSVAKLKYWLEDNNITSQNGRNLTSGNLYRILGNRAYIGEVGHNGIWYKGEHEAIIEKEVFDKVQETIANNRDVRKKITPSKSFLAGKLFDDKNNFMSPVWSSGREGVKYRYYVSQAIIRNEKDRIGKMTKISAPKIEKFIDDWFENLLKNEKIILSFIENYSVEKQKKILEFFESYSLPRYIKRLLIHRINIKESEIELILYKEQLTEFITSIYEDREIKLVLNEDLKTQLTFKQEYKMAVIDNGAKIIIGSSYNTGTHKDKNLIKAIIKSYKWNDYIIKEGLTVSEIAKRENVMKRYARLVLNLSFLSPNIITAILEGRQPRDLTYKKLILFKSFDWKEQEKELGFC